VNLREWIEREMRAKGMTRRGLAAEADISRGTLDNIFTKPDVLPEIETLAKLANVFATPLWRVVEITGFDSGFKPAKNADRIAQVLMADPELEEIAKMLGDVPAGDRSGVLLYLQLLHARRDASQSAAALGRSGGK
jgi:transcriptional regulator with XRE-family HTH domain